MRVLQATEPGKKVQLDVPDRKILFALTQNCRTPYSRIAKQAGLSRDAVRYRIQRLQQSGVLQGSRTIVDITRLGYLNVHLLLQLNQPSEEAERKLVAAFKAYPFVRAIIKFSGKYDFELALIAKGMQELETLLSRVVSDCGSYLQDYTLLFITKSFAGKTLPDNFLKAPEETPQLTPEQPKLDDTDYKLLATVADNAELPLHDIGHKLGVAPDTVKYRMKRLKAAGVIIGYVPVINYDLIGYNVYAILLNISAFTPQKEATLRQFLRTNKDVLWGVKTIGKYNVFIYICTTDPNHLIKTTAELR
ncbi:AsnC family transcriptional regulator, partial [Candidatus Woesearchaeota archaeon]|nr:AsnC family transcriptional regulator [Candidatus Woesearchaeota archaeon]